MAAKEERRWRIGYALAPKKQRSFIQASLLSLASSRGIDLVAVDPDLPVVSQGPFDALLHKLSGLHWRLQLQEFSSRFPRTPIIDHPDDIERLHNRLSMLQVVSDLHIPAFRDQETPSSTFGIPNQIVVYDAAELAGTSAVETLRFPMIAKPLVADGSAKSHKMALVFTRDGLLKQKPPLVLQEFVNHGGVIFKVYVVGDHVQCVKRKSLPDVSDEELQWPSEEGSMAFSQISNVTHRSSPGPEDDVMVHLKEAEMPPLGFLTEIARGLRKAMGLHLFNFDVIRDVKIGNHYLVIDINYFPGYAKMPSYEMVLTDFFWKIVHGSKKEDESKKEEATVLDDGDKKEDIRSGKHRHGMKEEVDPSEVQDKVDKKPVG